MVRGVDLRDWDWILVNTSAGKDSLVMLDLVCRWAAKAGRLDRVVAVHCDLGRFEWAGVAELAERQARRYGIRFEIVRARTDMFGRIRHRRRWPGKRVRWCTSDLKRTPVRTLMTALAKEWREAGGTGRCRILNALGLRAEEGGPHGRRAKLPVLALDTRATNQTRREVWTWLPIHDWKLAEIWSHIQVQGLEYHEAYDLGMPRLSCVFCIFATREGLVLAGRHNRALLQEHVDLEAEIGHTFSEKFSLAEIAEAVDRGEDPGVVVDWSDGGCA